MSLSSVVTTLGAVTHSGNQDLGRRRHFARASSLKAHHWSAAWIGLDVIETAALAVTGWFVLRRDARVRMTASAAAAFLLADAWLDIVTAQATVDELQSALLALFVELPLVGLCAALALTAPRWCVESGPG